MTAQNPRVIVITRCFDFPMERVFDAWIDPAQAARFLFRHTDGKDGAHGDRRPRWRLVQLYSP